MTQKKVTVDDLAKMVDGEVVGNGEKLIHGFADLESAGEGEITFLVNVKGSEKLRNTSASAVLVPMGIEHHEKNIIKVRDPYLASAIIHNFFITKPFTAQGIHESAVIGKDCVISEELSIAPVAVIGNRVTIGSRVNIGPGVVVGDDVTIGDDTVLKANVTIEHGCRIGDRVTLHSGVVIGSDGYGYAADKKGCHIKRPQVGIVHIEDDVEVGANSCIDRGTFGVTRIKQGAKIDNLVQVAHNVVVGENSLLVAQVGIAGSTTLGRNVVLGGNVAVKGHIHLEDGVMAAANSGVHTNLAKGSVVGGSPALPIKQWTKAAIIYGKLPEIWKELKRIKKVVNVLQEKSDKEEIRKERGA